LQQRRVFRQLLQAARDPAIRAKVASASAETPSHHLALGGGSRRRQRRETALISMQPQAARARNALYQHGEGSRQPSRDTASARADRPRPSQSAAAMLDGDACRKHRDVKPIQNPASAIANGRDAKAR